MKIKSTDAYVDVKIKKEELEIKKYLLPLYENLPGVLDFGHLIR